MVQKCTSGTLHSTGSSSSLKNKHISVRRQKLSLGLIILLWARINPGTHWNSACFSEKTRTQKSPSLLGSKVDGTMRYSPGGRQKREHTSRKLMKVSERAAEACLTKKLRSRWVFLCPTNCNRKFQEIWLLVFYFGCTVSLRGTDEDTSGICTVFLVILCFSVCSPYLFRNLWTTKREIW